MAENQFIQAAGSVSRFEIKRQGYTLAFEISPDALECRCFYEPSLLGGTPLTAAELQGHLAQFKIREGICAEAVASLLTSAASGRAVAALLLAQGTPMRAGEDGRVDMGVADDLAQPERDQKAFEGVDFRHVQSFLNVEQGGLVATLRQPGPGTAGRTVTGNSIPAQAGAPLKLQIGANIRISDDGIRLFALETGRVKFEEGEISVTDVYEIPGDVDFKVGNISFKGYVEVKGDVLDGFFIKATKGIKIQGNIGACTIESAGDIALCGMNGQGTGAITCGGRLTANFIYDTAIECSGDILVETEIRSCQIRCLGAITVNKGGITGGEYVALAGIECATLGSVTSLRTRVVAGVHYGDLAELNRLFNELKQLVAGYSAAAKGTIDMKEFARTRAEITERTQAVRSRTYDRCNPKINVKKTLHEGVAITLGIVSDTIMEEHTGPISIIENSIDGGLRFLGMTELAFKAQTIEQTFIQQHQLEQQKKPIEESGGA